MHIYIYIYIYIYIFIYIYIYILYINKKPNEKLKESLYKKNMILTQADEDEPTVISSNDEYLKEANHQLK